ncbi:unnamed protein product [Aphanomyces euteiches]|uniref:tRNA/rRNA methyltransferase SpoU type domain-containing protein n=1 Tax=Aphanomyces euteiches TaxID=100861 RepID=A0A6G0WED4_9STRA|nr:hypothetical protein Ae201684_015859 [Aphanomyces euteiches]KAH9080117.1 hypothetical protein Ae201684P_009063 [Aphanomyces euteiches]KAH9144309.1 hypothetical protein AeRB84_011733 [Aphanomyces euteiches]
MEGHEFYLVVSNVTGRKNLGTFLRTGTAFGVKQVLVVGSDRFGTHGGHNAHKYVDVTTFHTCADALAYLKTRGCRVLGLQPSADGSTCVESSPFEGPTAFVLGNEGTGLSEDQRRICDGFIHVSHYTPQQTTPSTVFQLDLTVQLGILLHGFTKWSGRYQERRIEDTSTRGKFELAERKSRVKVDKPDVTMERQKVKESVDAVMNDDLDLQLWSIDDD